MKKGKQFWQVWWSDHLPLPGVKMIVYQGRGVYTCPPYTLGLEPGPEDIFRTEEEALREAVRRCQEAIADLTRRADELSSRL